MKRIAALLLVVVMALAMLTACGGGGASNTPTEPSSGGATTGDPLQDALDSMEQMDLNMAICLNSNHSGTAAIKAWAEDLKAATNGKMNITIYADASLVANSELCDALSNGVCDIIEVDPSYCSSWFTYTMAFFLPGKDFSNNTAATAAAYEMYTSDKWATKESEAFKIIGAYNMSLNGLGWSIDGTPRTLEELKGKQIRGTGYGLDGIEALGGVPVGMTMGDVYEAFVKNTIQGGAITLETMVNFNFAECIKSYVMQPINNTPHILAFNNSVWESIPAPVQELIMEKTREMCLNMPGVWYDTDKAGYEACKANGVEVYFLTEEEAASWKDAMSVCKDSWSEKMEADGYADAQAYIEWLDQLIADCNAKYPTSEYNSFDFVER